MSEYTDSDDECIDNDAFISPQQPTGAVRLAHDKHVFDSWLRDKREHTYKDLRDSKNDEGSTLAKSNVPDVEDAPIISSPREYQTELFERAKKKNIIAVLDTG